MNDRRLTRRAVLRGAGGICVALPFLELFHSGRAAADVTAPPMRYVVAFAGSSLGQDATDHVVPLQEGALADLPTRGMKPLADLGVTDVTSLVSGLVIPWGPDGSIPAGGR